VALKTKNKEQRTKNKAQLINQQENSLCPSCSFRNSRREPQRAINFYEKLFGWTFQKWEGPMPYWLVTTGRTINAASTVALSKGRRDRRASRDRLRLPPLTLIPLMGQSLTLKQTARRCCA